MNFNNIFDIFIFDDFLSFWRRHIHAKRIIYLEYIMIVYVYDLLMSIILFLITLTKKHYLFWIKTFFVKISDFILNNVKKIYILTRKRSNYIQFIYHNFETEFDLYSFINLISNFISFLLYTKKIRITWKKYIKYIIFIIFYLKFISKNLKNYETHNIKILFCKLFICALDKVWTRNFYLWRNYLLKQRKDYEIQIFLHLLKECCW
jgi:hypothetical protein